MSFQGTTRVGASGRTHLAGGSKEIFGSWPELCEAVAWVETDVRAESCVNISHLRVNFLPQLISDFILIDWLSGCYFVGSGSTWRVPIGWVSRWRPSCWSGWRQSSPRTAGWSSSPTVLGMFFGGHGPSGWSWHWIRSWCVLIVIRPNLFSGLRQNQGEIWITHPALKRIWKVLFLAMSVSWSESATPIVIHSFILSLRG